VPAAKSDRLKQAKAEAEKEIKGYKAQREEQYQKRISDVRDAAPCFPVKPTRGGIPVNV
jgi:hypothetical protein